jgi:hypothetical protein
MDLAPLEFDGRSWYINSIALSTINLLTYPVVELSVGPHGRNDRLSSLLPSPRDALREHRILDGYVWSILLITSAVQGRMSLTRFIFM